MIQNFNIPGNLTVARAVFLQPGTEYEIRTAAVCPDGTVSHYFSSDIGTTLIVELVVSGFTLPNTDPTCGITQKGQYCEADPEEDKIVVFKIRSISNPNIGRYFGVFNADDECTSTKVKVYPGNSPFQFYCNQSTSPTCFAEKVVIKYFGQNKAEFSISAETNGNPQHLFCSEDASNDYEIVRYGSYTGVFDPVGGSCGGGGNGFSIEPNARGEDLGESVPPKLNLSVNPNPFTSHLDIKIPFANINENIELNLYDLQGQRVTTLSFPGGQQNISLDTEKWVPGMYFLRAESGGVVQTVKVVKTQ